MGTKERWRAVWDNAKIWLVLILNVAVIAVVVRAIVIAIEGGDSLVVVVMSIFLVLALPVAALRIAGAVYGLVKGYPDSDEGP